VSFSAPEQADQCFGVQLGVLSGWSDLVERYLSVYRYLNDAPPLWELGHGAFKVTGRDHGRTPVEDTAVCCDLARKAAEGVSLSLDLEAPELTADEGKVSSLMRLGDPELVDWGQRLLLGGEEVPSERRPDGCFGAHGYWPVVT
jgi:hypothetical protein